MHYARILRSPHSWIWAMALALASFEACGGETKADDDFGGGTGPRRDGGGTSSSSGGATSSGGASSSSSGGPGRLTLIQLSTLANHTCALWSDGKLKCWGNNAAGQLGLGDKENRGDAAGEMGERLPFVDVGQNHTVKRVATAFTFTCAVLEDGSVKCWGNNLDFCGDNFDVNCGMGYGDKLARGGRPGEMGNALPTVDLGGEAKDIVCGSFSCCALLVNDTIKCWGENADGELGYGDKLARGNEPGQMSNDLPPVDVGVSGVARLQMSSALFAQHMCAALKDGKMKCWGGNVFGQLGIGDTNTRGDDLNEMGTALPTVQLGQNVVAPALGGRSSCALLDDGAVRCWGDNGDGQLGYGDTMSRGSVLANFPALELGGPAISLDVSSHSCAVLANEDVKCWGQNDYELADGGVEPVGRLGYGDTLSRGARLGQMGSSLPAIDLGDVGKPEQVVVGSGHTCLRFDDNEVKCWGENFSGALGLGDEQNRGYQPVQMGDNLPFVDLGR